MTVGLDDKFVAAKSRCAVGWCGIVAKWTRDNNDYCDEGLIII